MSITKDVAYKIAEIIGENRSGEYFSLKEVMEIATQSYNLGHKTTSERMIKIIDEFPPPLFKKSIDK